MTAPTLESLDWLRPNLLGGTKLVGVMGWPVEHSVSPPMHNAAFRRLGLDWAYVPLAVRPEEMPEAVAGLRALGFIGANATVPHKRMLYDLVDELTPAAQAIGAANTLHIRPEGLLGHNTDAAGFDRALREANMPPEGRHALVLGAGGAARAVVYALASSSTTVTILNRTVAKAESLANAMADAMSAGAIASMEAGPLDRQTLAHYSSRVNLVVNTTPLGMWPHVERSPWPADLPFPREAGCYDLVYNPRRTQLLRQAEAAGAAISDGLGMLVHQGAEAFELWTQQSAPVAVMRAACEAVL